MAETRDVVRIAPTAEERRLMALAMANYPHWSRAVMHSSAPLEVRRAELVAMGMEAEASNG